MVNLRVIAVGKLKERWLADGCAEYFKRMRLYCKPQMVELDEERLHDNPSAGQIAAALRAEGARILEKAHGTPLVALCVEGKQLSSPALAAFLTKQAVGGNSTVSFAIGSSFGLDDAVKSAAALRLSMSELTFPHQLARLMLCEQLYRACTIEAGSKYHK